MKIADYSHISPEDCKVLSEHSIMCISWLVSTYTGFILRSLIRIKFKVKRWFSQLLENQDREDLARSHEVRTDFQPSTCIKWKQW